ncbi:MAG: hypothetical protein E7191_01410 [Erysipelotrichaceae bacterium]|nr:hypothetical protein [Erysipelotrichaceae bacterium]
MKNLIYLVLGLGCICWVVGRKNLVKKQADKLTKMVLNKDPKFLTEIESRTTKSMIEPFNREFLRLNYYVVCEMDEEIADQLDLMDSIQMNAQQRLACLHLVFQYHMIHKNVEQGRATLEKISYVVDANKFDPRIKREAAIDAKIHLENDLSVIDDINFEIVEANDHDRVVWISKKALAYKNNDRMLEAKTELQLALALASDDAQRAALEKMMVEYFGEVELAEDEETIVNNFYDMIEELEAELAQETTCDVVEEHDDEADVEIELYEIEDSAEENVDVIGAIDAEVIEEVKE